MVALVPPVPAPTTTAAAHVGAVLDIIDDERADVEQLRLCQVVPERLRVAADQIDARQGAERAPRLAAAIDDLPDRARNGPRIDVEVHPVEVMSPLVAGNQLPTLLGCRRQWQERLERAPRLTADGGQEVIEARDLAEPGPL